MPVPAAFPLHALGALLLDIVANSARAALGTAVLVLRLAAYKLLGGSEDFRHAPALAPPPRRHQSRPHTLTAQSAPTARDCSRGCTFYEGYVTHFRQQPVRHSFRYKARRSPLPQPSTSSAPVLAPDRSSAPPGGTRGPVAELGDPPARAARRCVTLLWTWTTSPSGSADNTCARASHATRAAPRAPPSANRRPPSSPPLRPLRRGAPCGLRAQPDCLSAEQARELAGTRGAVRLLSYPPSMGYQQNPISIYYCYSAPSGATGRRRRAPCAPASEMRRCGAAPTCTHRERDGAE